MPDAFVGLGNFAPLFAPPEILECYLPSFDGELAPSSIGWGDAFADWLRWRGHRGNRIAAQTGSSTTLWRSGRIFPFSALRDRQTSARSGHLSLISSLDAGPAILHGYA